ncbi:MAG: multiheme c-type cytochrome [Desulfosudaceae bacterium]
MPNYLFRWFSPGLAGLLLLLVLSGPIGAKEKFEIDRFISHQFCGDCHSEIYNQWEKSTHGLAHKDPNYNVVAKYFLKGLTDAGEIEEAEACVKCHTPVGVVTGFPEKTSDDLDQVPEIASYGVQCDYCHSATGTTRLYNNGLILEPGQGEYDPGVKRGPRQDAESDFHETAYSEFHTKPEICGTCHNVKHVAFDTDLETTYDEWKDGPYNTENPDTRIICQDCHMRQRPGKPATGFTSRPDNPGLAADMGPERPHVFTHYFVGANSYMPGLFDDNDQTRMAKERLRHAATLSIDTDKIDQGTFSVTITNTGAGHKLPTGLSNARQMWLDITVRDKQNDQTIFASGQPDERGYLADTVPIYRTVFGDGQGQPVENLAKAREVLSDNRIPPRQSATQTFHLPPDTPDKHLTINARLCYRIFSQKLIDQIAGTGTHQLPVVIMAEERQELSPE